MTSIVPRETNLGGSSLASLVSRGTGPSGLDSDGWEESHVYLRNPHQAQISVPNTPHLPTIGDRRADRNGEHKPALFSRTNIKDSVQAELVMSSITYVQYLANKICQSNVNTR